MALDALTSVYQAVTHPLPIVGVGLVDIAGAIRLSVALRQLRALNAGMSGRDARPAIENEFARNLWTAWTVVWGGETIVCALLAQTPSFLLSPTYPLLFMAAEALVHVLPSPPAPSLESELPLAMLDAFTRVGLLTAFALPPVLSNVSPSIANSPLALLITSTIFANGGFFIASSTSMLSPSGWKLATPVELKPWGWTSVDLWSASLVTGLFALMTRAQPFWSKSLDALLHSYFPAEISEKAAPWSVDAQSARSMCLALLIVLFSFRACWNFGLARAQDKTKKA